LRLVLGIQPAFHDLVAAHRRLRRERQDLARLFAVVAENDVAMQVVPARVRGPFVADEGRETARLIVLLGRRDCPAKLP
jgi:hypothetical protein